MSEEAVIVTAASCSCCWMLGVLAGVSTGVWAAVALVQPALAGVDGISETGASWITAGICLFGGLEAAAGAGALAGFTSAGITGCCIIPAVTAIGYSCSSFFASSKPTANESPNENFNLTAANFSV